MYGTCYTNLPRVYEDFTRNKEYDMVFGYTH